MRVLVRMLPGFFLFALLAGVSVLLGIMGIGDILASPSLQLAQWVFAILEASVFTALGAIVVLVYSIHRALHPVEPVSYDWAD